MLDYEALDKLVDQWVLGVTDDEDDLADAMASEDPLVRRLVASNPHLTDELLWSALRDSDGHVQRHALANSGFTLEMLEHLYEELPAIRSTLLERQDVPLALLEVGFTEKDEYARLASARNTRATAEMLLSAIADVSVQVREAATLHSSADFTIIRTALIDRDPSVRTAAMQSELARPEMLWAGIQDPNEKVRHAAAANALTTVDMLLAAASDSSMEIRKTVGLHYNGTDAVRKKAMIGATPKVVAMLKSWPSRKAPFTRTQIEAASKKVHARSFSDALMTETANRARMLSSGDFVRGVDRLAVLVEAKEAKKYQPHVFGGRFEFLNSLWGDAANVECLYSSDEQRLRGPELILVAEPSFNAIDADMWDTVLHQLLLSTEAELSEAFLDELLASEVADFETLCASATALAAVLDYDASSGRTAPSQVAAVQNHRRIVTDQLLGGRDAAVVLSGLPGLEANLWAEDGLPAREQRQMLYAIKLLLEYRLIVVLQALRPADQ